MEQHKTCKHCKESKPYSEFHKHKKCIGGVNTVCKLCRIPLSERQYMQSTPEYRMYMGAKSRAAFTFREFAITREDVVIPEKCPVFDRPFDMIGDYAPSIDRKDNSKGYTKDNIWVICKRANVLKGSATISEVEAILRYMKNEIKS